MTITLYLLKLNDKKFYVGQTNNLNQRYNEHCIGEGSKWTRQYKPIEISQTKEIEVESYAEAILYENWMTLHFMEKYGWENVRGGDYIKLEGYQLQKKLELIFDTENNTIKYYVKSLWIFGVSEKWIVYVLKQEQKKYYIGSTKRLGKSLSKHFEGNGIKWTKKFKPLEVIELFIIDNNQDYITFKTNLYIDYQTKYGKENVIGGQNK